MTIPLETRPDDRAAWRPGMFLFSREGSRPIILVKIAICLSSKASGLVKYGRAAMIANHAIERMMDEEI